MVQDAGYKGIAGSTKNRNYLTTLLTNSQPRQKTDDFSLQNAKIYPEKTISTQKTIQKTIQKKLTTVQKTILEYLAAHPYATQQNMAHDITIVSLEGVKYNLQVLQKNGFLRRIGPDKGGHWEIIEK